jgi:hypothetical protein
VSKSRLTLKFASRQNALRNERPGSQLADNCDLAWYPEETESLVRLQASSLGGESHDTAEKRVVGVIAAFVVVSLSFSAQAGEKKKITGTNKQGPTIFRTVVSPPGDDPKHELVALMIRRDTATSSEPDWNETEEIAYEQNDSVAGTGTHRGYAIRLLKNGDTTYGPYEGTHKTTVKEDGSSETTWEGTWKVTGLTGKFKNIKGGGTYRGKATAEGASTEWEGEVEY